MKSKLFSGIVLFMVSTGVFAQQYFSTPEQATDALAKAINEQNETALGIFSVTTGEASYRRMASTRRPWIALSATGR